MGHNPVELESVRDTRRAPVLFRFSLLKNELHSGGGVCPGTFLWLTPIRAWMERENGIAHFERNAMFILEVQVA